MQHFIETKRLILRRFMDADVDHLFALYNDPDVMRLLNGGTPTLRAEIAREYDAHFAGDGYWAAIEKATGEFLGWFGLHPTEGRDPDDFELGYRLLHRAGWGKGYASEGSRALMKAEWERQQAGRERPPDYS